MNPVDMKILLVDDDADFAQAVSSYLRANGCTVFTAPDGEAGLKLAKIERPDLIIMDVMMKERTEGFYAVQQIRHTPELKSVPVIVLSAVYSKIPEFKIPPDSGWLAHDEFLPKPVDLPRLLEKIRERIGRGETGQE